MARTVIVLIFTFIILWLPVNVISTWYKLDPNFPKKRIFFILKIVGHTMSYANPTINPIIYGTDLSCLKKLCISQKALNHQKTMSTNRQRNIEHYTMSTYSKIKSKVWDSSFRCCCFLFKYLLYVPESWKNRYFVNYYLLIF